MNNTFRFMAVLATAAAVLASCAKAEIDSPAGENADGSNVYQGPVKTLTFTAQTGAPQTKTSLGDVVTDTGDNKTQPVLWEADDEIKILYVVDGTEYSVNVTPKSVNGSTAVFEAKVPETGVETYYAVYPSVIESSIQSGETGELKVTIRAGVTDDPYQYGGFKNANIMVAKCQADAPQLNFKHACGIVRFKTGDKAPGQIFFYSGNRKANRGHAFINFEESGAIASISTESAEDKYVYVYAGMPDAEYYMPLWSDHTLEDGFIVAFRSSSFINTEAGWRVAYYPQDITLGRGEILDLGVIQNKIRTDYFVSTVAKGKMDGSSWENACDIDYVRNMFAKPADEDYAYAQQMKLENTNFWFAGDSTFVFGTDLAPRLDMCFAAAKKSNRCPINFYGGCTGTTGTDKSRDPENHPTVFSGDEKYAIFSVRNKTTLTLDGITLADARAGAANTYDKLYGAALYVGFISTAKDIYQYGLTFADYAPQVHVNNCIFNGNIESAELSGDNGAGSAINLKAGQVYVNKSHFDGNQSYKRGCIHASATATAGSLMYFNCCSFTGNSLVANQYGIVIRSLNVNTKVALNGCSFGKNSPNEKGDAPVCISSPCVFVNNTVIEDASNPYQSNVGIYRMAQITDVEAVLANNIIMDENNGEDSFFLSTGTNGDKFQFKSLSNLCGPQNSMTFGCVMTDLSDGSTGSKTTKTGAKTTDLNGLLWSEELNYWTWDGNVTDFTYATAAQMVAATKANTLIGDSFHDWLVEIGAIVNGQFTDCRGYLRAADKMCPGAYDPFATAQNK